MTYWLSLLPSVLDGLKTSLLVYVFTLLISLPLGLLTAYIYQLNNKYLRTLIDMFTWILRGTPLLLQLYFMFFALPSIFSFQIREYRLLFGVLTFALNYTAYFVEIFKGGFASIDKGQWEVSKMLLMTPYATLKAIILPQVLSNTLHALGNECINLIKDTSLLAAVALPELLMSAKEALTRDARIDGLVIVTFVYLAFTFGVVSLLRLIMYRIHVKEAHHDIFG